MVWGKRISSFLLIAGVGISSISLGNIGLVHWRTEQALVEARHIVVSEPSETHAIANEATDQGQIDRGEMPGAAGKDFDILNFYDDIQQGDVIGILYIPRLEREIPIISGTDEAQLSRGVGHFTTTSLPGQGDQILLSGHRGTVFRRLGELEHGDKIEVRMRSGIFTYEIFDTEIVDADDRTVIRSTAPDEILTLSTCYPFSYIGSAPDRYIIYAR